MNRLAKLLCGLCMGLLLCGPAFTVEAAEVSMYHPQLTVESYEIVNGTFEKSAECTLRVYIKNVDNNHAATAGNITLVSSYVFPVTGQTNQASFGKIRPGDSIYIDFEVNLDRIVNGPNLIEIILDWNDENAIRYSNSVNISPVLLEEVGFEIASVNIPKTVYGSRNTTMSVSYENTGNENLRNVYMVLEGDIVQDTQVVELEDISAGAKSMVDYSLELRYMGSNKIGISFRYEDRNGNEYITDVTEVYVNATDQGYIAPEQEMDMMDFFEEYRVYVIYAVVAVILFIPFAISMKRKGGKKK